METTTVTTLQSIENHLTVETSEQFAEGAREAIRAIKRNNTLPSKCQLEEMVYLDFTPKVGSITGCRVEAIKVHVGGKYTYDIDVSISIGSNGETKSTVLKDVEECYITGRGLIRRFAEEVNDMPHNDAGAGSHITAALALINADAGQFPSEWDEREIEDAMTNSRTLQLKQARYQLEQAIKKLED